MGTITKIEVCKKNKDKVNVFVDDEYNCCLTSLSVMNYRLKVGQPLTEEKLKEIKNTSETDVAFSKAIDLISRNMKTVRQMRDYLTNKGFEALVVDNVIDKLNGYNYVNDTTYAKMYVDNFREQRGKRRLSYELKLKGVNDEDIQAALCTVDEQETLHGASMLLAKFFSGKSLTMENIVKANRYLLSRGYDFDTISTVMAEYREHITDKEE